MTQDVPSGVAARLKDEFQDRLRLRWSVSESCWHVEQRVARFRSPLKRFDPANDRAIRQRDGFDLVLRIYPGNRVACPACGSSVVIPSLHFIEVACKWCELKGRKTEFVAAYFPLDSEAFFEHLRKIDPERGGLERTQAEIETAELWKRVQEKQRRDHDVEVGAKEDFKTVFQIQSVGYTGKETMWDR